MNCILATVLGSVVATTAPHFSTLTWKVDGDIPSIGEGLTPIELCSSKSSQRIEAATTVRIWNRNGRRSEGGSGTVIGKNKGKMLILTCDHIYGSGVGRITVRRGRQEETGIVVARSPHHDASIVLTSAMDGPVAPIHKRETKRGDLVTLSGFGGGNRGFMLRVGPARNGWEINALSNSGDSGGGAFVEGKLVGVVWGHEKFNNTESKIVPLRNIYYLSQPVKKSRSGAAVYQKDNGITLTASVELTGFPFQGLFRRRGGKQKFKGRGYCGPEGCEPQFPGGGGKVPEPGEPWYAPGFGPEDEKPAPDPDDSRPAPNPSEGDNGSSGGSPVITPGPNPGDIEIDLSQFATKSEVEIQFKSVNDKIDGLGVSVGEKIAGLATKPDIEIIVSSVGNLRDSLETNLQNVNDRFETVEAALVEARKPPPEQPPKRHWVLVGDPRDSRWSILEDAVNRARVNGAVIITVDYKRIEGVVAVPQLVPWVDGRPQTVVTGQRDVIEALRELQ